ncbi:MAG TPA: hypothetical protein VHN37_09770 [Actinomycetota bacterium]|nr:hypothetical protein [Actinomycetota bacterium]
MSDVPFDERERAEAERVADALREVGYAAHVESFEARESSAPWLAAYAGLSALAALLVSPLPLVAALLGTASVVLHARESDGRPLLVRASCIAGNVVALARHAPVPDVVVVAPLADRAERLSARARRALSLLLQILMVAVAAGAAVAWVAEAEAKLPGAVAAGGAGVALALVVCTLSLYRPPRAAPSAGAAAEVLVSVAPLLAGGRFWLVATGAPDATGDAVRALLEEHRAELSGCAWLSLETGSEDRLVAVSEEGHWRERRADRWLLDTAEEAGATVGSYRAGPTNATPLLARRRRALTLLVGGRADDVRILVETAEAAAASAGRRAPSSDG